MQHLLFYDSLKEAFDHEGESIAEDLSEIGINLIRDIHDNTMEMIVETFGKTSMDAPITSDIIYDPETYIGKQSNQPTVCPRCLMRIFEDKLVDLFIKKGVKIHWNRDWQTQAIIDPTNLHLTPKLEAEDQ